MMSMMIFISFFFMSMTFFSKYILTFLILMEFMIISMIFYLLLSNSMNLWMTLTYLVMTVCEAIISLSMLVSINFNSKLNNLKMYNMKSYM